MAMQPDRHLKKRWIFPLLALPLMAWLLFSTRRDNSDPDLINLALRRTADQLLRASGDSTSRVPAIEQFGTSVWRVKLTQPFPYEQLPAFLQGSLDKYGISRPYHVALRRCEDATIDLGYQQLDFLEHKVIPCSGRDMPDGCHFIEITFAATDNMMPALGKALALFLLTLAVGAWGGIYLYQRQKRNRVNAAPPGADWLSFGNSKLYVAEQILLCNEKQQSLTFRETKLLHLFATRPGQLLERDFILQQVWADEGILVGRSIDMFVSRLRKKLAHDPSLSLVAVHGVGYRLQTEAFPSGNSRNSFKDFSEENLDSIR